jgi:hypothetical protein
VTTRRTFAAGFLQRRECVLPTCRAWVLLLLVAVVSITYGVRSACHFLTVSDPSGGVLVVEGWVSPRDARDVLAEFKRGSYPALYVTGGPIEPDSPLIRYGTYAALTTELLTSLGADPARLHSAPADEVKRDRTYASALALKDAMAANGEDLSRLTLMTSAVHSRRSRLLYSQAFGRATQVGIIPLRERGFDPDHWWTTSVGFRSVTSELIAYAYARFVFRSPAARR